VFGSHVTWYTKSYWNLTPVGFGGSLLGYTRSHKLFHIRKVGGVARQRKHLTATPSQIMAFKNEPVLVTGDTVEYKTVKEGIYLLAFMQCTAHELL